MCLIDRAFARTRRKAGESRVCGRREPASITVEYADLQSGDALLDEFKMNKDGRTPTSHGGVRPGPRQRPPIFAALDLGTNNCRLLMAQPNADGSLKVVDGFSRIVRLGEGLAHTGRLSEGAMSRAYQALAACAQRIEAREPVAVGCVATQACRAASNGQVFLNRIEKDLGLKFEVISAEDEARLSVLGCASLLDRSFDVALIVDTGGGSTELAWVSPAEVHQALADGNLRPPILGWASVDLGVVGLADEEVEPERLKDVWYDQLVERFSARFAEVGDARLKKVFADGRAHIIGTSGTVTSFAGLHLKLEKYDRSRVDGMWLSTEECRAVIRSLLRQSPAERARHPCIGRERSDLIVLGGAIFDALCAAWPVPKVRVADRGLREGVLMRLFAEHASRG